jgi:hypothetical protein
MQVKQTSFGCMRFLFPKEFVTIFGLGYTPCKGDPSYFVTVVSRQSNFYRHTQTQKHKIKQNKWDP